MADDPFTSMRVAVYPAFDARYYSLYLHGLHKLVGSANITYTSSGFPRFGTDCLAMRIGNAGCRVYIHSNDMPELDPEGLEWSDVFGKVNLSWDYVPEQYRDKVINLGPTLAVQTWGPVAATARGFSNYLKSRRVAAGFRQHMATYRAQYASRFEESEYRPGRPRTDYVFFNAALWEREPEANASRARFVEACRSIPSIRFEGGLTPRNSARGSLDYKAPEYTGVICRRYTSREYILKTKLSAVVLNNPAYRGCHSWRFAEYLAMGKAIISLPLVREVPASLKHGEHIHFVDGSLESFVSAVERIHGDDEYRSRLERNARAYYEEYLSPTSVIERVLKHAELNGRIDAERTRPESNRDQRRREFTRTHA